MMYASSQLLKLFDNDMVVLKSRNFDVHYQLTHDFQVF